MEGPGYLIDPEPVYYGISFNDAVRPTSDILGHSCLVLLGEPGSGKTAAIDETGRLIKDAHPNFDVRPVVRLGTYADEGRLLRDVFGAGPAGDADAQPTVLLLDGLDECKLNIPHVGMLISQRLAALRPKQVRLVISCRSADWPSSLDTAMAEHYADYRAYELQPLRRTDVGALAAANGAHPQRFLDAVEARGVGALATRPLSLRLLLHVYDRVTQSLPDGQQALYEKALLALAEEVNPGRRDAGRIGQLSPRRRLALAERIAAAMHFAGASAIWTGAAADAPEGDLTVEGLLDAHESVQQVTPLSRSHIEETLDTALFSGRGHSRVGWAHQTYMEFLTASHLARAADAARTRQLLCDQQGRVVPHLRPVAAWLTSLQPGLLREVIASDPQSFVGLGIDLQDDEVKAMVVYGLLREAAADRFLWDRPSYAHLNHERLEAQLRPVLEDRNQPDAVRTVAVDISEDSRCVALQDAWAAIALDHQASPRLRANAGHAVLRLADTATKYRLLPLALGHAGEDPDDELKGMGLSACWPGAITLQELLPLLTPPKRDNLLGAYKSFLISDLPQHIEDGQVAELLAWLADLPGKRTGYRFHAFGPFRGAVVNRALALFGDPAVTAALVALALRQGHLSVSDHDWPVEAVRTAHAEQRHALLQAAIAQMREPVDVYSLTKRPVALFSPDDFPLIISECQNREPDIPPLLAVLALTLFIPEQRDHAELVLALERDSVLYQQHFARWREPMSLNCEAAQMHAKMRALSEPPVDAWTEDVLRARLSKLLAQADDGDLDRWWQFCYLLAVQPGEAYIGDELTNDLTTQPGWPLLSHTERSRAFAVAERYLHEYRLEHQDWLTTNIWPQSALAGYQSAALLLRDDPQRLAALHDDAWRAWAAVCLAYPVGHQEGSREVRNDLLQRAYRAAPDTVLSALRARVGSEAQRDHFFGRDAVEAIWDEHVASALYEKLAEPDLVISLWSDLIDTLIEHEYAPAVEHAMSVLLDGGAEKERRIGSGLAILTRLDPGSWPGVWALLRDNPTFGRDLLLRAGGREGVRLQDLEEMALHDFYVWLSEQFPPEDDPDVDGAHFVGAREAVAQVRDRVGSLLVERGTSAAVEALGRLAERFPNRPWLGVQVLHAEEARRRKAWTPISPEALVQLLDNPAGRLVRSAAELSAVVIEALHAVQRSVEEDSEGMLLWNDNRPKPEEQVSLYLANRLRDRLDGRGIVANREVQVRPSPSGKGIGERTDIHIDAAATSGAGALSTATVVIEVKGIWHDQVTTAMRSQLWDRYLKPAGLAHGLYVVLVPDGNKWDADDRGQKRATQHLAQGLEQKLRETADELTGEGAQIVPVLFRY